MPRTSGGAGVIILAAIALAAEPITPVTSGGLCARWNHTLAPDGSRDFCRDEAGVGILAGDDIAAYIIANAKSCGASRLPARETWSGSAAPRPQLDARLRAYADAQCWTNVVRLPDVACTGVLVAPLVVLTAGHCADAQIVELLVRPVPPAVGVVGWSPITPVWSTEVARVVRHKSEDLALLLLLDDPGVAPVRWVDSYGADWSRDVLLGVGYGLQGRGRAAKGELSSTFLLRTDADRERGEPEAPCGGVDDREPTCRRASEFVGQSLYSDQPLDAAPGDSGGAVFAQVPTSPRGDWAWVLVGIVSRGREDRAALFGEGGVYARPDAVFDWMIATIDSMHRTWVRMER
jgi:hypothetical protein